MEGQPFSTSYDLCLLPHPLPHSSVDKLSLCLSLPLCRRSNLLTGGGRGWGRSQIIRRRKKAWSCINHSILSEFPWVHYYIILVVVWKVRAPIAWFWKTKSENTIFWKVQIIYWVLFEARRIAHAFEEKQVLSPVRIKTGCKSTWYHVRLSWKTYKTLDHALHCLFKICSHLCHLYSLFYIKRFLFLKVFFIHETQ